MWGYEICSLSLPFITHVLYRIDGQASIYLVCLSVCLSVSLFFFFLWTRTIMYRQYLTRYTRGKERRVEERSIEGLDQVA